MFDYILLLALLVGLTVAVVRISNRETRTRQQHDQLKAEFDQKLYQRDQQWRSYIEAFTDRVDSDKDKALIQRILHGDQQADNNKATQERLKEAEAPKSTAATALDADDSSQDVTPKKSLDNGLLLLYLGAFLFVVAAGLFVGFADFSGEVRTMVVALVAGLFYISGINLHRYNSRLHSAGIAFASIGMAIAPLVGLSLYAYVFDETGGTAVWLGTSLAVFVMYLHALYTIRSSFISYLLIFSLVSLMQSAVAIFDVPTYYFIWMLIATGLLIKTAGHYSKRVSLPELESPSYVSSNFIVPLSVIVSIATVFNDGYMQLAVTFGFAGVFYGLNAITTDNDKQRMQLAQVGHIFAILAIVTGAYAAYETLSSVTLGLLILSGTHAIAATIAPRENIYNVLATNILFTTVATIVLAWNLDWLLLASLITATVSGVVIAYRYERKDGLLIAMVAIALTPYIMGLRIIEPSLEMAQLTLLSLAGPIALLGLRAVLLKQNRMGWLKQSTPIFAVLATLPLFTIILNDSPLTGFIASFAIAAIFALMAKTEGQRLWEVLSSLSVLAFVLQSVLYTQNPELILSVMLGLAWCVGIVLYFRTQVARWVGSGLWLAAPLAMGLSGFDFNVSAAHISWMYIAVFVGFMLARTIVSIRDQDGGVNSPKDTKESGRAYIAGYWSAAAMSLLTGLMADNTSLQVSLMSAVLAVLFWTVGRYVEEEQDIVGVVPVLVQIFAFFTIYPSFADSIETATYLAVSSLIGLAFYTIHKQRLYGWLNEKGNWRPITIATIYVNPASIFIVGTTNVLMPIGLALAGTITLLELRNKTQGKREVASFVMVAAAMWMLYYIGVDNLQAYTHILAIAFGLFALWRHRLGDYKQSNNYLLYMFFTATIPLALQAIGGEAGGIYGWMLILQQIGFILLGMYTGKKHLSKWGLYVTMGAVLYQMRDLEWAVLLILAISIIGAALYYINKQNNQQ